MYILYKNKDYLIIVDYYLDYFEVDCLYSKIGSFIISKLKVYFVRYGIFDIFVFDNGLFFNGQEFVEFLRVYEFNYVIFLLNCVQFNGKVENVVKVIKCLINKSVVDQKDLYLVLLDFRNIFSQDIGYFVVQRIFGRRIKILLFVLEDMFKLWYVDKVKEQFYYRKGREMYYYNKGVKELLML